ncbi:SCO family protein [Geminicoccus roseus]|uniref:SCO family protein n=1 Tax=Geminicoccus roseus TaxID=404900 RepID=UPI0004275AC2|nr:SCO family protein [Geminicoccus roseus]
MTRLLALAFLLLASLPAGAFDPFAATGIDQIADAAVPLDRPFLDQSGRTVTLRELAGGKPLLLAPVLHDCPNICGVTLAGLAQAVRAQPYRPGEDFAIVAFGIDPKEGPALARRQLDRLARAFPAVAGQGSFALTGTQADIQAVTQAIGYRYAWDERIGQYAHVAAVALLTPDGRLARWLYGLSPDPTDLRLALTEAGQGRIGDWAEQVLLLCYHYDPQTGRYGPLVWTILRVGGTATALVGAGLIGWSLLRERRARRRAIGGRAP